MFIQTHNVQSVHAAPTPAQRFGWRRVDVKPAEVKSEQKHLDDDDNGDDVTTSGSVTHWVMSKKNNTLNTWSAVTYSNL